MLILTRRTGEETEITVPPSTTPTKIVMTILGVKGNQVRNGWSAPRNVTIHRREIQDKVDQENDPGLTQVNGNR